MNHKNDVDIRKLYTEIDRFSDPVSQAEKYTREIMLYTEINRLLQERYPDSPEAQKEIEHNTQVIQIFQAELSGVKPTV